MILFCIYTLFSIITPKILIKNNNTDVTDCDVFSVCLFAAFFKLSFCQESNCKTAVVIDPVTDVYRPRPYIKNSVIVFAVSRLCIMILNKIIVLVFYNYL